MQPCSMLSTLQCQCLLQYVGHCRSCTLHNVAASVPASSTYAQAEERAEGRVATDVYRAYITSWGPWLLVPAAVVLFFIFERGLTVCTDSHDEARLLSMSSAWM